MVKTKPWTKDNTFLVKSLKKKPEDRRAFLPNDKEPLWKICNKDQEQDKKSALTTSIHHCTEDSTQGKQVRKRNETNSNDSHPAIGMAKMLSRLSFASSLLNSIPEPLIFQLHRISTPELPSSFRIHNRDACTAGSALSTSLRPFPGLPQGLEADCG